MKLYFAPLEGITTYIYRNLHNEMFSGCDMYFSPFITPTDNERLSSKSVRDILKERSKVCLVPQCLANSAEAVVNFTKKVFELGYREVNINLGCPASTVVSKRKGAGALKDLERLDKFLSYIFENSFCDISIKTRTGFYSHDEFCDIIDIYNKYPVSELTVHPRIREEFYKGEPNFESFDKAYKNCHTKLCYNGNVTSLEKYEEIIKKYPNLNAVMIGRGAIKNPAIFREIRTGKKLLTEELIAFSKRLENEYMDIYNSDKNTLYKLKEIWIYQIENYPDEKKIAKAIKKAEKLFELNSAINCLPEL